MLFAQVVVKSKAYFNTQSYTYRVPEQLQEIIAVGQRVVVPFGKNDNPNLGIIIKITKEHELDVEIKSLIDLWEITPILDDKMINIAIHMAEQYMCSYAQAVQSVLPPGDIGSIEELFYWPDQRESDHGMNELKTFLQEEKTYKEIQMQFGGQFTKSEIHQFVKEELIQKRYVFNKTNLRKKETFAQLNEGQALKPLPKNALKQRAVIEILEIEKTIKLSDLLFRARASASSVKALENKGYIQLIDKTIQREVISPKIPAYNRITLNSDQKEIYNHITTANDKRMFLIHGVTGSGKTEIYLQLVENALAQGKDAIILVPEISLTPQTIERFAGRFKNNIAVYHSRLTTGERFEQWEKIKSGEVKIVVGARSAIFAPFKNLGLIIVDEEHELSYISEKNPKYNAVEIGEYRARKEDATIILGSATPSIRSYYLAKEGYYELLELKTRASAAVMPSVEIVDMREELKRENYSVFSQALFTKVEETLKRNEQIILFLNKRGHTSYVFCRNCGYIQKCDACDVAMTYHLHTNHLVCHYCGRTARKPIVCPQCGSPAIKEYGAGTEKLEEETRQLFPEAKIARMDADTVIHRNDYKKIYDAMKKDDINILIGTQMIAKGLDFQNVTLVGIVSADINLNIPDFRASEKTYQLLTQVAGRAGRGDKPGEVIIQTYLPKNSSIQYAASNDYLRFYEKEIEQRAKFKYAPFYDVFLIRIVHKDRRKGYSEAVKILAQIRKEMQIKKVNNVEITGPTPAVIERINNKYRFNIIIKTKTDLLQIKELLYNIYMGKDSEIRYEATVSITLNPLSLN